MYIKDGTHIGYLVQKKGENACIAELSTEERGVRAGIYFHP